MLLFGFLLLAVSGVAFYFMRKARSELHAMIGADTLPVSQLEMLRGASDEVGAQGGFRKGCEVVGQALPRPEGKLTAELSNADCVWFTYQVKRRYRHVHRDQHGHRRTTTRTEIVARNTSTAGYSVRDPQGMLIGVDPNGASTDRPEQVMSKFVPQRRHGPNLFGLQLPTAFDGNRTLGYEYHEWIIRPGQPLYVLGEVHDRFGPLVMGQPVQDGHFIISTRSEQQLRADR